MVPRSGKIAESVGQKISLEIFMPGTLKATSQNDLTSVNTPKILAFEGAANRLPSLPKLHNISAAKTMAHFPM